MNKNLKQKKTKGYCSLARESKYKIEPKSPIVEEDILSNSEDYSYKQLKELNYQNSDLHDMLNEENSSKFYDEEFLDHFEVQIDNYQLLRLSLHLGLVSFGGPGAHKDLFRKRFVSEGRYMTEKRFRHLLELSEILPGYSSSTLLSVITTVKTKSIFIGILAMILFNLPSFFAVLVLGILYKIMIEGIHSDIPNQEPNKAYFSYDYHPFYYLIMVILTGITQGAVGLMVQSTHCLSKKLSNSFFQITMLVISGVLFYYYESFPLIVLLIILCGLLSVFKGDSDYLLNQSNRDYSRIKFTGLPSFITFGVIFCVLLISKFVFFYSNDYLSVCESFFRIGSLSIGEGHVIIPMIFSEFNDKIEEAEVLNGYTLSSLLPGSMFNMAGYIGLIFKNIITGVIAEISIFIPGLLIVLSALPYSNQIKSSHFIQFFIRGANSAALGFLFATALKLWIDSCFTNPYTNPIVGTLNCLICYILVEAFKVHKPYIILFGAVFMLVLMQSKTFFNDLMYI